MSLAREKRRKIRRLSPHTHEMEGRASRKRALAEQLQHLRDAAKMKP